MLKNIRRLHDMIVEAGRESEVDLMEDGGLNAENAGSFVANGMTVGEFSSPLLKGPQGKFEPGAGGISAAVRHMRQKLDEASKQFRSGSQLR